MARLKKTSTLRWLGPNSESERMLDIRATTERDAHYLLDIDIKCFDYAWLPEDWRNLAKTCLACVATWNGTPIGMVIFANNQLGGVDIEKIAVKPPYRNQGIGRRLLRNCALYAREIERPNC